MKRRSVVLALLVGLVGGPAAGEDAVVRMGTAKRLTWDDSLFATCAGIEFRMHAPHRTEERNIVGDQPWESWQIGGGHKLLREGNRWRIWYTVSHGIRSGEEYAVASLSEQIQDRLARADGTGETVLAQAKIERDV